MIAVSLLEELGVRAGLRCPCTVSLKPFVVFLDGLSDVLGIGFHGWFCPRASFQASFISVACPLVSPNLEAVVCLVCDLISLGTLAKLLLISHLFSFVLVRIE